MARAGSSSGGKGRVEGRHHAASREGEASESPLETHDTGPEPPRRRPSPTDSPRVDVAGAGGGALETRVDCHGSPWFVRTVHFYFEGFGLLES